MPAYNPLVSIIINTHNSTEYLAEAIDSAYQQTYSNTEIIVYDNASTKNVQEITNRYDSRLKYFRSDKFLTLGGARNQALKLAKGELIDFLDADDLFLAHKLETQVPLFQNQKVALVFSNSEHFQKIDGEVVSKKANKAAPAQGKIFGHLLKKYYISWDSAIFRKSAIGHDPKNWFNELFNSCTDYDLFLRLSYFHEIEYVDQILSKWRSHDQNLSKIYSLTGPTERLMMIPLILKYEPKLFEKHAKNLSIYLASIYSEQCHYYWKHSLKKEAILCALHAFFHTFRISALIQAVIIPFCPYRIAEKSYRLLEEFTERFQR